jgi:hypothetical protein
MDYHRLIEFIQKREIQLFGDCISEEDIKTIILNSIIFDKPEFEAPKRIVIKKRKAVEKKKEMSVCEKFIDKCRKRKLKVYKYQASLFWTGPAIVINGDTSKSTEKILVSMRKLFNTIPLNLDKDGNKLIIYPQCKPPKEPIKYDFTYSEEIDEIDVSFWEYGGQIYIVDTKTNYVFDSSSHEQLGVREKNDAGEYNIVYD